MAGAHGGVPASRRETGTVTRPLVAPTHVATEHGSLGLPQGIALYIGSVLGTGLLVLPGIAAQVAGPASIVAVIAVIVLSIPLAGTFAALAARFPDPGGVASYARRALGDTKDAVLLRQDQVLLLADDEVTVDAHVFRRLAEDALASGAQADAEEALAALPGAGSDSG